MKNACVLSVLMFGVGIFTTAQTQASTPLDCGFEKIERVEILYFPEQISVRAALTPQSLEQLYGYKLEIRDVRESSEWERLLPYLRQTSLTASGRGYDHRIAVLLFDKDGRRIGSLYFDQFGEGGTINEKSGAISADHTHPTTTELVQNPIVENRLPLNRLRIRHGASILACRL